MKKDTVVPLRQPEEQDLLSSMLREGAQRLIAQALQAEFDEFMSRFVAQRDELGRAAVVRNGFQPEREVLTGLGAVGVRVPKARSRTEEAAVFRSTLVPPYVRRAKSLDAALPWLYLHGVSTGNMREALGALVGREAAGLSASVVARLKSRWMDEYRVWRRAKLGKERWVYLWVDGIYSGLRAEDQRLCVLVVIAVNERGQKRFLAIEDGIARIQGELGRGAARFEEARVADPTEAGRGRWGAGILGRARGDLSRNAPAALLGAQDGQRAQLPASLGAAKSQSGAARDLDGRDQGERPGRLRSVPRRLRCEVPQGH